MKKIKLLLPLICAGTVLTGCAGPLDAFTEMQPLETPSDFIDDSTSEPSEPSEDSSSSEEEPLIYKAVDIAHAFNEAASLEGYSFYVEYWDIEEYTGWWAEISFYNIENNTLENSKDAALFLTRLLPDYTYVWIAGYVDAAGHRDDEYAIVSVNPNISSAVEVYGYLDNSYLNAEIYIYDIM